MLIRCPKCGYENFPQHRFCGMCAAELPPPTLRTGHPEPPVPLTPKVVAPSRPAVAKQEPERVRNLNYLLEDEPEPASHWGRYAAIVLFVGVLAFAGWYWRSTVNSLAGRPSAVTDASAQPAAAEDHPNPEPSAQSQPPASTQASAPTTQVVQPEPSPTPPAADTTAPASNAPEDAQAPADPPARSPKKVKARVTAPTTDDAEIQGENYLYGNGVQQNCTRARQMLMTAAQRSNAKAQSVLATMYATGHCATRDLPTAYKWFSRSLRKDPNNTRIEQDLKVLWNQMTAEERNRALQSE